MPSPREILSRKPAAATSQVTIWFAGHPEAADFVQEWAAMKAAGDTDWGTRRLVRYLRETFGFPFTDRDAPLRWLTRAGGSLGEGA